MRGRSRSPPAEGSSSGCIASSSFPSELESGCLGRRDRVHRVSLAVARDCFDNGHAPPPRGPLASGTLSGLTIWRPRFESPEHANGGDMGGLSFTAPSEALAIPGRVHDLGLSSTEP